MGLIKKGMFAVMSSIPQFTVSLTEEEFAGLTEVSVPHIFHWKLIQVEAYRSGSIVPLRHIDFSSGLNLGNGVLQGTVPRQIDLPKLEDNVL